MRKTWLLVLLALLISNTFTKAQAAPLTIDQVKQFNNNPNQKVKISQNFDPNKIRNLVVGCDPVSHSIHFFGGPYKAQAWGAGDKFVIPAFDPEDDEEVVERNSNELPKVPNISASTLEDGTVRLLYQIGDFVTHSFSEALKAAGDAKNGPLRSPTQKSWEVDPEETLFLSYGGMFDFNKNLNFIGSFEDFSKPDFLKPLDKVFVEYYSLRSATDLVKIAETAYMILKDGGELYLEVDHENWPIRYPTDAEILKKLDELISKDIGEMDSNDWQWKMEFSNHTTGPEEKNANLIKARALIETYAYEKRQARQSGRYFHVSAIPTEFESLPSDPDFEFLVEMLNESKHFEVEKTRPIPARSRWLGSQSLKLTKLPKAPN